jgi:hypothetical protein
VAIDRIGRFSQQLQESPELIQVEMADKNGRLIEKKLVLPQVTPGPRTKGEIPADSYGKLEDENGKLSVDYEFHGVVTNGSRIVYQGKEVGVENGGKFSIPLRIREGESDHWIQLVSPEGYGRFVKLSTSLQKRLGAELPARTETSGVSP